MDRAWADVDRGRRDLDWSIALGEPDDAAFVSDAGRVLLRRMASDLEAFFGPGWLHRAVQQHGSAPRPTLAPYWPSLTKLPGFVNAVGLWARLQLLTLDQPPGVEVLRKNLQSNPVGDEFHHHVTLARLAVQARLAGARVEVEPEKPTGGPGDLRIGRGDADVFIEIRGLGPGTALMDHEANADRARHHLWALESRYKIRWAGDLPAQVTPQWQIDTEHTAREAAESGLPRDVLANDYALTALPEANAAKPSLASPDLALNQGHRVLNAIAVKARQTASAGAAWVWLADNGSLWPLTEFAWYPLAQKVDTLARFLVGLFEDHPHLLGVVVTSSELRFAQPVDNETAARPKGAGIRRTLFNGLVRDSIVLHRNLLVPAQFRLLVDLCASEPTWLDDALHRLDVPSGLGSLVARDHRHLVGPRPRPDLHGLYVP